MHAIWTGLCAGAAALYWALLLTTKHKARDRRCVVAGQWPAALVVLGCVGLFNKGSVQACACRHRLQHAGAPASRVCLLVLPCTCMPLCMLGLLGRGGCALEEGLQKVASCWFPAAS